MLSLFRVSLGTFAYMSPEQIRKEKLDARTDLFSFGLILYEMATGRRAFPGESAAVVHEAILQHRPSSARELRSSVPRRLNEIISRALEKDRAQRYQSAMEMREDLLRARKELRSIGSLSRNWLAIVASLLILGTAGALFWRHHSGIALAPSDTLVLADVTNQTSDPALDEGLSFALLVALEQTPYLNLLGGDKLHQTARRLGLSEDTKITPLVTPQVAMQVCRKTNSRAVVSASIRDVGNRFRFSRKAVSVSFASTERTSELNSLSSAFIACSICSRVAPIISLLLARSAPAGFCASLWAVSVAVSRSFPSGTTLVTNPNSAARLASNGCPRRMSSAARIWPMRAGTEADVPNSGATPRSMKGIRNLALSPAYTKSQCVSMVVPPPMAAPCTATTIGLSKLINADINVACGLCPGPGGFFRKSSISFPAQNESPAPCQSTTRMLSSCKALFSRSANVRYMLEVIAFFFAGRLNMTRKMLPERSVMISFICPLLPAQLPGARRVEWRRWLENHSPGHH